MNGGRRMDIFLLNVFVHYTALSYCTHFIILISTLSSQVQGMHLHFFFLLSIQFMKSETLLIHRSGRPTYPGSWVDQVTWIPGMLHSSFSYERNT